VKLHAVLNPGQLKAFLTSYFYVAAETRWQTIRFCIDTGSPVTIIAENDRILMGIEYAELERDPTGNFGIGGKVDIYESPTPLTFEFVGETGVYSHTFPRLRFMRGHTRQARIVARVVPSIVGLDFIMDSVRLTVEGRKTVFEVKDQPVPAMLGQ